MVHNNRGQITHNLIHVEIHIQGGHVLLLKRCMLSGFLYIFLKHNTKLYLMIRNIITVGENIIGASKLRNNYGAIYFFYISKNYFAFRRHK